MRLGWRVAPGSHLRPRARVGAWIRALGAVCALGMLSLMLTGCAANLTMPVTLANTPVHGVTVPAEIRHGDQGSTLVVVEVVIHGKGPYPMALDTGASLTLIDRSLANKLALPTTGPMEQITGVGGAQNVTPVSISKWSLGQAQLPNMTITSAPLSDLKNSAGVDGLLGSDVLDRFGAITIDYADAQVTLYQITSSSPSKSLTPQSLTPKALWTREAAA
ncbi:MAG TPA: retropepsin-like aspartic protease [Ktedonobacterales bacterium]